MLLQQWSADTGVLLQSYENIPQKTRRVRLAHKTDIIEHMLNLFQLIDYHGGVDAVLSLSRHVSRYGQL